MIPFLLILNAYLYSAPELHVCTVANYAHPFFGNFLDSCHRHNIPVAILGWEKKYLGHGWALQLMDHYIQTLPDEDIILVVDSFDIFFVTGKEEILEKFHSFHKPIYISAEDNCAPDEFLKNIYPPSSTPYCYVNSGTYMGYVKEIKRLFKGFAHPICPLQNHQRIFTLDFLRHPEDYHLDEYCCIAQTLHQAKRETFSLDPVSGRVTNKITGSTPCLMHGNGTSPLLDTFHDELVQNNSFCLPVKHREMELVDDLKILERLIEKEPDNLSLLLDLANYFFASNQLTEAGKEYQRIIDEYPLSISDKYWCSYQLAQIAAMSEAPEEKIKELYAKAYAVDLSHPEPLFHLAKFYLNKGMYPEAYKLLELANQLPYQPFGSYFNRDICTWMVPADFALAAYYTGYFLAGKEACKKLLSSPCLPSLVYPWTEDLLKWTNAQLEAMEQH